MTSTPSVVALDPGPSRVAIVGEVLELIDLSWLVAIIAVFVAWIGSRVLAERLRPRLEERMLRPSTANAVLLAARIAVVLYAFVPIAGLLGFRPQNVFLSFTVISLVLGAILAPVGRSYISGLFILFHRPYEVGDMIELVERGERGYVDDITLGYTKVFTLENAFLVVPNETMRERDVRNLSAEDERCRLSIEVCVTYESDLERACDLLEAAAREVDGVIAGGPPVRVGRSRFPAGPTAFVREFADHGILIELQCWLEDPYLQLKARSAINRRAWAAFEDEAVEIAYPHTHLVFDETSGRARVGLEGLEDGSAVDSGAGSGAGVGTEAEAGSGAESETGTETGFRTPKNPERNARPPTGRPWTTDSASDRTTDPAPDRTTGPASDRSRRRGEDDGSKDDAGE